MSLPESPQYGVSQAPAEPPAPFWKRPRYFKTTIIGIFQVSFAQFVARRITKLMWKLPGSVVVKHVDPRDKDAASMDWANWIEETAKITVFGRRIQLYVWKLTDGRTLDNGISLKFLRKKDAVMFVLLHGN